MSATRSYPLSVPLQHPDQGFDAWKPEFLVRDHDNTLRKLFKKGIECLPVLVTIDPSVRARLFHPMIWGIVIDKFAPSVVVTEPLQEVVTLQIIGAFIRTILREVWRININ